MKFAKYLLAASLLASTMITGGVAVAQKAGGTIVIGTTQKPRHLNPAV